MSLAKKANAGPVPLETQIQNFRNLWSTVQTNEDKLDAPQIRQKVKQCLNNLEAQEPRISQQLATTTDVNAPTLRQEFAVITKQFHGKVQSIRANIARHEQPPPGAADDGQSNPQADPNAEFDQQLTEEQNELEYLQNEAQQILVAQRTLTQLTQEVHDEVQKGHETLMHIDNIIEGSKQEMEKGNQDLKKGEDHLKKTCNVY